MTVLLLYLITCLIRNIKLAISKYKNDDDEEEYGKEKNDKENKNKNNKNKIKINMNQNKKIVVRTNPKVLSLIPYIV
jgi:Sec-independent protein translocase protein TatA